MVQKIMNLNDDEYNIYCDQKILHELNQKIIEKFGQTNFTGLNLEK